MKKGLRQKMIQKMAEKFAADNYSGDPRAVEMISCHLQFQSAGGGKVEIEAYEEQGIRFFMVGQNASHQFSMGMKDGRCFSWACGESGKEDEDGFPIPESRVTELAGGWNEQSYWGHW